MQLFSLLVVVQLCITVLGVFPGYSPQVKPAYCNEDPTNSTITPLTGDELALVKSLKQVQVMLRHGARTPWGLEPCWKDYDVSWNDCNVTELMLASPAIYPYDSQVVPEPWLFRKVYDAFTSDLGGLNCLTGQLLAKGYDQEQENGRILAKQYLNQTDSAFNLFDTNLWANINPEELFLRSDDEQRTLMSGQTVLSTLFDVTKDNIVTWHTGDIDIDQIAPNSVACPALTGVQALAMASPPYLEQNSSERINNLTSQLDNILGQGYWNWYNVIDCFMTTVCTDREIPANQDTGAAVTDEIFNATITQVEYTYAYNSNYNHSRFAKLGMGHTIYEMRTRLQAAVSNDADAIKFGMWSAHDTSIMPLLSALLEYEGTNAWDQHWAQYAALVTIELYESATVNEDDLFRMTYNGKPLVLPNPICNGKSLCTVTALLDAMSFAQDVMPCEALPVKTEPVPVPPCDSTNANDTLDGLNDTDWTGLVVLATFLGAFMGAVGVILYNRHAQRKALANDPLFEELSTDSNGSYLHQNLIQSKVLNSGGSNDQRNQGR